MGFLDKVKETAGKAADQAKHATAVGKEKIEDVRLQKKIGELCQDIGALVVAQRRNEAPEDAAAQIDAKVAEIAEIEKQIEASHAAADAGDVADAGNAGDLADARNAGDAKGSDAAGGGPAAPAS